MHHIHRHYHFHVEPDPEVLDRLDAIFEKLGQLENAIMPAIEDLKPALDAIDAKVTAVKTDVDTLIAKLAAVPTPGLTPEQQAAIDDAVKHAQSIAESLGAIDTQVNPPSA